MLLGQDLILQDADQSLAPSPFLVLGAVAQEGNICLLWGVIGLILPLHLFCHQVAVIFAPQENCPPVTHISALSGKHLSLLLSVQVHPS